VSLNYSIISESNVVIFKINGKISTQDDSIEIVNILLKKLEEGHLFFVYDISELDYITSSGLNFFIRSLTKIRNHGGELVLSGIHGTVEKLFLISKLNEVFKMSPSVKEAISLFSQKSTK
jgi:anti-sigma B factor antagonist